MVLALLLSTSKVVPAAVVNDPVWVPPEANWSKPVCRLTVP